jgi:hypothetical protein
VFTKYNPTFLKAVRKKQVEVGYECRSDCKNSIYLYRRREIFSDMEHNKNGGGGKIILKLKTVI